MIGDTCEVKRAVVRAIARAAGSARVPDGDGRTFGHHGRMDEAAQRAFDVELRLRGLATDILEHEGCEGCRINAAQALEFLGDFDDTRRRLGFEDPREAQKRRPAELRARAAAGRPPRLRLGLDAEIVVHDPSEELQDRIFSAVKEAVEQAIQGVGGAVVAAFTAGIRIDS